MKLAGTLLTHSRYRLASIDIAPAAGRLDVRITTPAAEADLCVTAYLADRPAPLPPTSPFRSDRDARRFAGPLPWTFDYEPQTSSIVMIRGRPSQWPPHPVPVEAKPCPLLQPPPLPPPAPRLPTAFHPQ